ncbi:hypothetical protein DFQ27_001556 [Actinomortierella ambigua]|uniref:Uncharacterized protein n=1 Tax=Actinomortierella ambigua TaxID=1343610 RepID=A0A9P6TV32_9FUNG|nr:hypothetical protein DFQ27_001556 [Actinomortierella ambigua]
MQFDLSRAKEGEMDIAIQAVFDMFTTGNGAAGGGPERIDPSDVLVSIGMGNFGVNYKLTSLHGTFKDRLVRKLRGKGYAVVGINEKYTSKCCPRNMAVHGYIIKDDYQHDQDLATVQGFIANNTRLYGSLAHEPIQSGVAESEVKERAFDFLNIALVSAANGASKISRMRGDIYFTALGI